MKASGAIGLAIFALIWTAIVGALDAKVGWNLFRAVRALDYPEAAGTVLSSEVTQHRGSKGRTSYGVAIRYRYDIDGTAREGDRYRYSGFTGSSDSKWAHAVVRQNPAGASVKVYYDPANPEESVLSRGINGADLFILLFLTPFNLIMFVLWAVPVWALRRRVRPLVAGDVKWWADGRTTRVRLPRYSPIVAGLAGTGGTAFASIFILGFGFGGDPSLAVAMVTWMVVIGVGVGVAGWQWLQQRAGKADLVLDDLERTAELPATFGRKERRTVPWSEITGVTVETIERRGRKGGTRYRYAVQLKHGNQADKLDEWHDQQGAESFAAWLRERLNLG
jgi:hypothetical protein